MSFVYERPDADVIDGEWTDNSTPPTQTLYDKIDDTASGAVTNPAAPVLLLHMNGTDGSTTFTDSSASAHTVTPNGDAQIDTAQSKFGGASGLFDGTGDYLDIPGDTDVQFGTGDFTIDFWIRENGRPAVQYTLFDFGLVAGGQLVFLVTGADGNTTLVAGPGGVDGVVLNDSVWTHVAFTRSNGVMRAFQDGVIKHFNSNAFDINSFSTTWRIGADRGTPTHPFNGWIDEVRIIKGAAAWTSNFTPPTRAYGTTVETD